MNEPMFEIRINGSLVKTFNHKLNAEMHKEYMKTLEGSMYGDKVELLLIERVVISSEINGE